MKPKAPLKADIKAQSTQATQSAQSLHKAKDKRFNTPAWQDNPFASALADQYLAASEWIRQQLEDHIKQNNTDAATAAQWRFQSEQWIAATAPSNYLATNPDALAALQASQGKSLQDGLAN